MHKPFDITSISHENKWTDIIYSGDPGFPFISERKYKCLISKEETSFTLVEAKNFSTYFSFLLWNQKRKLL